jgi:hypothetical protein
MAGGILKSLDHESPDSQASAHPLHAQQGNSANDATDIEELDFLQRTFPLEPTLVLGEVDPDVIIADKNVVSIKLESDNAPLNRDSVLSDKSVVYIDLCSADEEEPGVPSATPGNPSDPLIEAIGLIKDTGCTPVGQHVPVLRAASVEFTGHMWSTNHVIANHEQPTAKTIIASATTQGSLKSKENLVITPNPRAKLDPEAVKRFLADQIAKTKAAASGLGITSQKSPLVPSASAVPPASAVDENAWMLDTADNDTDDDGAAAKFEQLSKKYKKKKRSKKATVGDEINFRRAQHLEEARLKLHEADNLRSHDCSSKYVG